MEKTYTCIVCPMSCRITVEEQGEELRVSGNTCKKGYEYAESEHKLPKRIITSTAMIDKGRLRRLPVVSSCAVPKDKLNECLKVIYTTVISAPVKDGDIIIENICGTGANIIASRDVEGSIL